MIKIAYALEGDFEYQHTHIRGNITPQMVEKAIRLKYELMEIPIVSISMDLTEKPVTIRLMLRLGRVTHRTLSQDRLAEYEDKILAIAQGPGVDNICPSCGINHDLADILLIILNPFRMQPFIPMGEDHIHKPAPLHPLSSFSRN